jgi:sugar phosphate isomerase/epimerase
MNQLSISVRIAEGFQSKEHAIMDLSSLTRLAREAGYDAMCMRASQIGIQSTKETVDEGIRILGTEQMPISMMTGDFDIVYNNDKGPDCLRGIDPYLKLAKRLNTRLLRVALKTEDDIPWAQKASDQAAEQGLSLVHQCHSKSLFETLDGIEATLSKIDRPNFGLIFEPANLELCGQPFATEAIERLAPWIMNVYFQNQIIKPDGEVTLETWCRGPVSFDIIEIHEQGGIDFESVITGLKGIGYSGTMTVHQCAPEGCSPSDSAISANAYLRQLIDG